MNELYLRTWHRRMGAVLAFFLALQAVSGLVLTWLDADTWPTLYALTVRLHHGDSFLGTVYRSALGLGLLGMACSGALIFFRTWQRLKRF